MAGDRPAERERVIESAREEADGDAGEHVARPGRAEAGRTSLAKRA